jgi:hypothetical protein
MATKKIYDMAVKVGTYQKDGQDKNKYQNIGAVFQKDDGGMFAIIEPWFNPAGAVHDSGKGVMVSLFSGDKKPATGNSGAQDDEIPF